jgi:hypothetical protein
MWHVVREVILKRIKEAKYFTVVFDETTDISKISQLSIVITYVHGKKKYEYFVEFIDDHKAKVTGEPWEACFEKIERIWIECEFFCRNRDGWMFSDDIRKSRGPCFNHALNLTISVSSSVVSIRNSIRVIKETIAFLTYSAKRRVVVDSICVRKIKKTLRNKMGRASRSSCRFF